jgi:hypothetical protein
MLKIICIKLIRWYGAIDAFSHKKLARAATIAAAIIASSGSLTARPLFAGLGEVALQLTAGLSEVEAVRRKITKASAPRCWVNNLTFRPQRVA